LIAQTLLTVLTQNSRPEEIARHGASSILGLGMPALTGRVRCDAVWAAAWMVHHSISCNSFCDRLI